MREELLEYYERELTYMRQMGGDFARKYPRVAGRLLLNEDSCADPHVERLLQGFAFLAGSRAEGGVDLVGCPDHFGRKLVKRIKRFVRQAGAAHHADSRSAMSFGYAI